MKTIYLDHHATTPVDPAVLEVMLPYFSEKFGNAASRSHPYGWQAEEAVELARSQVAELIGATGRDIIFTSGATESINLAIKGIANFYRDRGNHIITVKTEHRAVLDCFEVLEKLGYEVTYVPVDEYGAIALEDLENHICDKTILISVMFANHEIGTIHNVAGIGRLAKDRAVFFHCDATQAVGKEEVDVEKLGVDLLSISGHKIYAPKGIGALYVRRRKPHVRLVPLISGGGHERNHRPGTLNVPGIVALGKACEIVQATRTVEQQRLSRLRDSLWDLLDHRLRGVKRNGHPSNRLSGNLNVSFADIDGRELLVRVQKTIAVSSGSSCTSAIPEPSYILKAIGVPTDLAQATIRFGIGRFNTEEEVETAGACIIDAVNKLRSEQALRSHD